MTHAHTRHALPHGLAAATLIAEHGGTLTPAPLLVRGRHARTGGLRRALLVAAAVPALLLAGTGIAAADTGAPGLPHHVNHSVADAQLQQEAAATREPCPAGTTGGWSYGQARRSNCTPTHYMNWPGDQDTRWAGIAAAIVGVVALFPLA